MSDNDFMFQKLEQIDAVIGSMTEEIEVIKTMIGEIHVHLKPSASPELQFDPARINWKDATDKKGNQYKLATQQDNFPNKDWDEAKKLLESGGGSFRQKDGKSWLLFPKGDAIGVWNYGLKR